MSNLLNICVASDDSGRMGLLRFGKLIRMNLSVKRVRVCFFRIGAGFMMLLSVMPFGLFAICGGKGSTAEVDLWSLVSRRQAI